MTVSLLKAPAAKPLAKGTLFEVKAELLEVGDTVILGNCVRKVLAVGEAVRRRSLDAGDEYARPITTEHGRWELSFGQPMMVLR